MADTNLCVLVKVITKSEVPPALMVPGVKVLETNGTLAATPSRSATVQVPEAQPAAVLETPTGAEIDAVLVIWVWALAICGTSRHKNTASASTKAPDTWVNNRCKNIPRLIALNAKDKLSPNEIY